MILVTLSFFSGLFVVVKNTKESIGGLIIALIGYLIAGSFVSFFSGWSGMLIGGYGN